MPLDEFKQIGNVSDAFRAYFASKRNLLVCRIKVYGKECAKGDQWKPSAEEKSATKRIPLAPSRSIRISARNIFAKFVTKSVGSIGETGELELPSTKRRGSFEDQLFDPL
jgi:hypothetical protein